MNRRGPVQCRAVPSVVLAKTSLRHVGVNGVPTSSAYKQNSPRMLDTIAIKAQNKSVTDTRHLPRCRCLFLSLSPDALTLPSKGLAIDVLVYWVIVDNSKQKQQQQKDGILSFLRALDAWWKEQSACICVFIHNLRTEMTGGYIDFKQYLNKPTTTMGPSLYVYQIRGTADYEQIMHWVYERFPKDLIQSLLA